MICLKLYDSTVIYSTAFIIHDDRFELESLCFCKKGEKSSVVVSKTNISKDAVEVYFRILKGSKESAPKETGPYTPRKLA